MINDCVLYVDSFHETSISAYGREIHRPCDYTCYLHRDDRRVILLLVHHFTTFPV